MKSTHWNSDHPIDAPAHDVMVWIAHQPVNSRTENCEVRMGRWNVVARRWCFENNVAVSAEGHHVCGWLPIEPAPTYEVVF